MLHPQALKGFSALVPFYTRLENNLQNSRACKDFIWFLRIKKKRISLLINLIPFLYLPPYSPSRPFFSKLFCLQYVTGNELYGYCNLNLFSSKYLSSKLLYLKKYGWGH